MRYIDIILLSMRIFRVHRLRTILTILAVSVGVAVIIFLVALGYGLQQVTIEKIANIEAFSALDVTSARADTLPVNDATIEKFKKIDQVADVSPLLGLSSQIIFKGKRADVALSGVSASFFALDGLNFSSGASFSDAEKTKIVVSKATLKLLGIDEETALGQNIGLVFFDKRVLPEQKGQTNSYSISGVLPDESIAQAFIPIDAMRQQVAKPINYDLLKVKVAQRQQVNEVKSVIAALGYSASAVVETIDEVARVFRYVRIILGGLGLIALFVASIGMFNTMTISLLERIREIGIMRSIGASDRDIWVLFLTESWIIGLCGSCLGVIIGVGASRIANLIFNIFARTLGGESQSVFLFPPIFLLSMLLFAQLVSLGTGVYPAYRAVKVNPLDALRYE